MSPTPRQEETPLLLLFLEDSSASPRRKHIFGNNSRYNRISEGASTVFTQWPAGQVTTCCLATFIFLVFFITFLMIMLATSFHPTPILPRCLLYKFTGNSTRIYLVHHGEWQPHQLQAVEEIIASYPDIPIDLVDLWNTSRVYSHLQLHKRTRRSAVAGGTSDLPERRKSDLFISIGTKEQRKKVVKSRRPNVVSNNTRKLVPPKVATSLGELCRRHPNIEYTEKTMNNFFIRTPLHQTWRNLNLELVEFAARVLPIWEYGGISFKLPEARREFIGRRANQTPGAFDDKGIQEWRSNLSTFQSLPEDVVNIDDECDHMETKTPCHSFFGDLIMNMRHATFNTTVKEVINATLKALCLNGDVTDSFCSNFAFI